MLIWNKIASTFAFLEHQPLHDCQRWGGTLEKCLESIKDISDEIIIMDTGSKDRKKEISFKWIDDFSASRNHSFKQVKMDYILWLDADDVLLLEDCLKLLELNAIVLQESLL